ncbi:MAG: hypothetical protein O7G13_17770, partial [Alphaproteobacteria bacterium]|nr:hypothetical protein [Alphaproteobacteria bacterium]
SLFWFQDRAISNRKILAEKKMAARAPPSVAPSVSRMEKHDDHGQKITVFSGIKNHTASRVCDPVRRSYPPFCRSRKEAQPASPESGKAA